MVGNETENWLPPLHDRVVAEREEWQADMAERPRAVLVERERRYFLGEKVVEPNSDAERSLRQNVRIRLKHSLLDLSLLGHRLEDSDVTQVFDGKISPEIQGGPYRVTGLIQKTIPDVIALLFRYSQNPHTFAKAVEEGIERAALVEEVNARATVDIDVKTERIEELRGRLEDEGLSALSLDELKRLRDSGELTQADYHALASEHYRRRDEAPRKMRPGDHLERSDTVTVDWSDDEPVRSATERANRGADGEENNPGEE